jgi:nucleotide-binding universal stress UspA family protein
MIERILFPVDFSALCGAMAGYVKRVAAMFQSEVTLVHVCDPHSHHGFEAHLRSAPREVADEQTGAARRNLESFLASEFPPETHPRILLFGDAATQIAEAARSGKFDLILMPTHTGRFRRVLLGSTTAKVLNDAACPVLTTEHCAAVEPRPLEHREWVCGVAMGDDAERVVRFASRAASQVGAKLSLVHVVPEYPQNEPTEFGSNLEIRRRLVDMSKAAGCEATVYVVPGPVKELLLETARACAADALIVGRPQAGTIGRMRDLTYALVRDSPFPVVSV